MFSVLVNNIELFIQKNIKKAALKLIPKQLFYILNLLFQKIIPPFEGFVNCYVFCCKGNKPKYQLLPKLRTQSKFLFLQSTSKTN
jgi:hypothetical protein